MRSELARGNWDVLEAKPAPTLADFLRKDFLPFTKSKCAEKPATVRYYAVGTKSLLSSDLAGLAIDKVTDQHAGQYAARHSHLSPSTVNCGLRTLRRALYLAAEWGKLNRKPKITLAKGERQRDRVLTDVEVGLYLEACEQPWRDARYRHARDRDAAWRGILAPLGERLAEGQWRFAANYQWQIQGRTADAPTRTRCLFHA